MEGAFLYRVTTSGNGC